MVATQLDFVHLRTTAGVAGHIKWVARFMKWENEPKKLKKYLGQITENDEFGIVEDFSELVNTELKFVEKEEKKLYDIIRCELILFNEEQKNLRRELKLDEAMRQVVEKLSPQEQKALLEKLEGPLRSIVAKNKETSDRVRRVIDALRGDQAAFLEMQRAGYIFTSDKGMFRNIIKDAKKEKRDVKKESQIKKVFGEIDSIEKAIRKGQKAEALRHLKVLLALDASVFKAMEDELKYILDVISRASILFLHLVASLEKVEQEEAKVESEGFPRSALAALRKNSSELKEMIQKHREDLYKLARYEDSGARAA